MMILPVFAHMLVFLVAFKGFAHVEGVFAGGFTGGVVVVVVEDAAVDGIAVCTWLLVYLSLCAVRIDGDWRTPCPCTNRWRLYSQPARKDLRTTRLRPRFLVPEQR